MIEIRIPIKPIAKARARSSRSGHFYTPKRTSDYEEAIAWYVRKAYDGEPFDVPLSVSFVFCFKHSKKRGPHTSRPDQDNLVKAVSDACNGILWDDDCLIAHANVLKVWDDEDFVSITVNELETKKKTLLDTIYNGSIN